MSKVGRLVVKVVNPRVRNRKAPGFFRLRFLPTIKRQIVRKFTKVADDEVGSVIKGGRSKRHDGQSRKEEIRHIIGRIRKYAFFGVRAYELKKEGGRVSCSPRDTRDTPKERRQSTYKAGDREKLRQGNYRCIHGKRRPYSEENK